MKIQFIYVGRLDKEKGIEGLIYAIHTLIKKDSIFTVHIYGKGQYDTEIQNLAHQYPDHVHYYGWMKKNDIIPHWKTMDYFIMPSQFLETFGLTACESLLCGVPVIGNKKGGLVPFIDDKLNIQQYKGNHDGEKLTHLIEYLINNTISKKEFSDFISTIHTTYSKQSRYRQIQPLLPSDKSILYISDYINYNGGGIETHIHDSREILKHHHHSTTLYGHQAPIGQFALMKKFIIMAMSICNIPDTITLSTIMKKKSIGLIRRHSISRVIGWLPVMFSHENNQIISHHELGLFHPYPSKTYDITQIPKAWSLASFLQAGKSNNPITILSIIGKFFLIRLLHKQLTKKVKTHIVPSERMIDIVQQRHPEAQVICIPHFVDV